MFWPTNLVQAFVEDCLSSRILSNSFRRHQRVERVILIKVVRVTLSLSSAKAKLPSRFLFPPCQSVHPRSSIRHNAQHHHVASSPITKRTRRDSCTSPRSPELRQVWKSVNQV